MLLVLTRRVEILTQYILIYYQYVYCGKFSTLLATIQFICIKFAKFGDSAFLLLLLILRLLFRSFSSLFCNAEFFHRAFFCANDAVNLSFFPRSSKITIAQRLRTVLRRECSFLFFPATFLLVHVLRTFLVLRLRLNKQNFSFILLQISPIA